MGGYPVEMSRPRNTERFDALHSLLSFGMITACVEERGGFYCFLTDFLLLSLNCLFQQWLVMLWWQQRNFPPRSGALVTVGGLEMVLGVMWREHWRAVLLVVRGQWTCKEQS